MINNYLGAPPTPVVDAVGSIRYWQHTIIFKAGENHSNADGLSRLPCEVTEQTTRGRGGDTTDGTLRNNASDSITDLLVDKYVQGERLCVERLARKHQG